MNKTERHIRRAQDALAHATALQSEASRLIGDATTALSMAVEAGFKPPQYARLATGSAHLRHHKPGKAPLLDTDPELRAFVLARIDAMTYNALADEIAARFPPNRRLGKSALQDWWSKNGGAHRR